MDNKIEQNPVWEKQAKALAKTKQQLHFPLLKDVETKIRVQAAQVGENPSNTIRRALELDVKSPVRPRLGASFTHDEMIALCKRYNIDPIDQKALIRRIAETINLHFQEKPNNHK